MMEQWNSPLYNAVTRMTARYGARSVELHEGVILRFTNPLFSDFLPRGAYFGGICTDRPLQNILLESADHDLLQDSHFLVVLGDSMAETIGYHGLKRHGCFNVWKKFCRKSEAISWQAKRVESVDEIREYCSFDPSEPLPPHGPIDAYTEWLLVVGSNKQTVGKARITDLGQGNFFLSKFELKVPRSETVRESLKALENYLALRQKPAKLWALDTHSLSNHSLFDNGFRHRTSLQIFATAPNLKTGISA